MREELLETGARRLRWAKEHMRVLGELKRELASSRILSGIRIGMAVHVEAKTGILALALKDCGAHVALTSCNPLSTDDSVASALRENEKLKCYARRGQTEKEYYEALNKVLDIKPDVVIDDGADLIMLLHKERRSLLGNVMGACEETTTGVTRLRHMAAEKALRFPVISVNDAQMKHLFDNRYGTGQSTMDGLMAATNLLVAGKSFVVAGYGWCGRGIAMRAKGMGARVTVTEVDPVRAIEAKLDGFEVMPMGTAVRNADFIVTATGGRDVVSREHLKGIKDGCVLANAGHFDVEVSKRALEGLSKKVTRVRDHVEEYALKNGRKVYLLGDGRLINLVAGQGHPVEIMDLSFSLQALSAAHIVRNRGKLRNEVYEVPRELDERVARIQLKVMGVEIDVLTKSQLEYSRNWEDGT